MLLILGLSWSPEFAHAQDTETQQLSLEQGKNVVSLRVQPADASFASIFEGHLDQISLIKDEVGSVYIPDEGIEQLTTWDANEGYKVYATGSFDVEVTGAPLSLTTTTVPLGKGGNLIPYLPAEPQAVDEALVSVSSTLVRVEDEAENVYEPDDSSPSLDSLRTGKGYALYVDQPDTLAYTIQAATLADALNLEGVQVGQHVRVQGRDESGDGGGGMFVVTNSGGRMDGATVLAFDEDLTQTTETVNSDNFDNSANPIDLAQTDLAWRGFEVRYGPDPEDVIGIEHLHGHNKNSPSSVDNIVDLQAGIIGNTSASISQWREEWGYNTVKYEVSYQYATSDRRLERKNVGNSVNLAWWGTPEADSNSPETADNHIGWALNIASRIYDDASNGYDWTYVDIPGEYYFRDFLEIPSGVKLRGIGSLNADGFTRGTLTWMPGEMVYFLKSSYSWQTDSDRERAYASNGRHFPSFLQQKGAEKIGMEKLLFDGNVPNNMDIFNNSGDYDDPYSWMQNSGAWSALYVVNNFPDHMPVEIDDVVIKNMGGSGLPAANNLGGVPADFTVNNLNIDTARRNHLFYGLSGAINNVTLEGHYWGGNPLSTGAGGGSADATYTNLTVKNLEPNPQFLMGGLLTDRRGGITIDGFTIDLETSTLDDPNNFNLFSSDDQGSKIKNGTINTLKPANALDGIDAVALLNQRSRGQDFADESPTTFSNITVTDHGVPLQFIATNNFSQVQDLLFKDITVTTASGVSGATSEVLFATPMDDKLASNIGRSRRYEIRNVDYQRPLNEEFRDTLIDIRGSKGSGTYPVDFFFVGSSFDNQASNIVARQSNTPAGTFDEVRVYFDDMTYPTGAINHSRVSNGVVRMRNSQDGTGRTSDESGTYTSDASDEGNDFVLIPTSLMSNANGGTATVTSGTPSVTSVESANGPVDPDFRVNLDQSIGTGNTIEVDWTARVTPLGDFSTTGLFPARAVADKSYTSGNGPFALDLRGVAASQESRDKINYTASSGDTSVVTASVQSNGYTLELTEQGTGTVTITVTGEIEGVGTTTEMFVVSIP